MDLQSEIRHLPSSSRSPVRHVERGSRDDRHRPQGPAGGARSACSAAEIGAGARANVHLLGVLCLLYICIYYRYMPLSLKDPEADRLAREVARRTGETITGAI